MMQQRSLKKNESTNSKSNIKGEDGGDDEDKLEEQMFQNEGDDTVTHKKKRKRNVESRDVWT